MLTREDLLFIMPNSRKRVDEFLDPINATLDEFEINTPERQAAFLAQIAHESGELRYVKELASGEAYEGREDLGNVDPGIGVWTKGRGLIEITGEVNYEKASAYFGVDFVFDPEQLEKPEFASRTAGWFWRGHGLNALADAGDFLRITKRINGGTNGLADRQKYWARAKTRLGVA